MNSRNYRTEKGTELPLLNLRGKQYLEVKYRLVWFREDHPDWSIETDLVSVTDVSAYAKATIRDQNARIIATSHKFESIQGFPDFIEKAETGAIGRALALIGYGTQFCADDLDEGRRIVDAPAVPTRGNRMGLQGKPALNRVEAIVEASERANQHPQENPVNDEAEDISPEADEGTGEPQDYTISFGRKYKGKKLKEIPRGEMESYIRWLEESAVRPGTALSKQVEYLKNAFERLYNESAH